MCDRVFLISCLLVLSSALCLCYYLVVFSSRLFFFFQAEDGIRDLVRSRGLGDVYKRQARAGLRGWCRESPGEGSHLSPLSARPGARVPPRCCLLYTSDAADERSSVDLGGRRIIKKKKTEETAQLQPRERHSTRYKDNNENETSERATLT